VDRCLSRDFDDFFFLLADDTCGDILLVWKSTVVAISNPHYSNTTITGSSGWWFTGIYGPQSDADKSLFLLEIKDVRDLHPGPWAVAGDFSLIVDAVDKSNANP
jgi:hypothetical protein